MPQKVVLIADPGIDTAFAIALALNEPALDVQGILATAGNVGFEQATQNVHVVIEQLDPPRWPRLGAAPPVIYDSNGEFLHGPGGLGGVTFPCMKKHAPPASDRILVELVHEFPKELTVVALGPLTVVAQAFDREPELPGLVEHIVCLGGTWHEPGNASAVTEFHFACDPASARQVLRCGAPITQIPLDLMRKIVFSPTDLLELPSPESRTCQFLRQIVPFGIRATSNRYGVEGFHLKDVLGIVALTRPGFLTTRHLPVDVETRGELTRGMSVVDARVNADQPANVHFGTGVDVAAVHAYIDEILGKSM